MKRYLIAAVVLISVSVVGCFKDGAPLPVDNSGFSSTWKYIGFSGGLAGYPFTPVDTTEHYLQIDTIHSRILISVNGQQACSDYTIEKSSPEGYSLLTLKDSITFTRRFDIALFHDTLTLYPHGYADAFVSHYYPSAKNFTWCDTTGVH